MSGWRIAAASRTLQREQSHVVAHVLDGDAERVGVPRDVREVLGDVRRVHDHHDVVGKAIDEAVVLDRAAIVENRRIVDLPDGERRDVVGRDEVHEINGAVAADDELAHVRDVEQAALLAHGLVLGGDAHRVLDGHLVAGEGDDLGAEGERAFRRRGCGGARPSCQCSWGKYARKAGARLVAACARHLPRTLAGKVAMAFDGDPPRPRLASNPCAFLSTSPKPSSSTSPIGGPASGVARDTRCRRPPGPARTPRSRFRGRRRAGPRKERGVVSPLGLAPTRALSVARRSPRPPSQSQAKAAALAFSLINNHPFVDGNKRVGHAALETFVLLNGFELPGECRFQRANDLGRGRRTGVTLHLGVIMLDDAGDTVQTVLAPVWSSTDTTVVTIDQTGTFTTLKPGTVTIRVSVREGAAVLTDSVRFSSAFLATESSHDGMLCRVVDRRERDEWPTGKYVWIMAVTFEWDSRKAASNPSCSPIMALNE